MGNSVPGSLEAGMGILDDMENCINDNIRRTQSRAVIVGAQQSSFQEMTESEVTEQRFRSQSAVTRCDETSVKLPANMSSTAQRTSSRFQQIMQELDADLFPANDSLGSLLRGESLLEPSHFRERPRLVGRSATSVDISEFCRNHSSEDSNGSLPYVRRQRSSWVEQSSTLPVVSTNERILSPTEVRTFSSGLNISQEETSSERQLSSMCETTASNRSHVAEHARSPEADPVPLSPSVHHEPDQTHQNITSYPEAQRVFLPDAFLCGVPGDDRILKMRWPRPNGICSSDVTNDQLLAGEDNDDVFVVGYCKPKLIRLRSEPSTVRGEPSLEQWGACCCRQARSDLKRSHSLDVTASSSRGMAPVDELTAFNQRDPLWAGGSPSLNFKEAVISSVTSLSARQKRLSVCDNTDSDCHETMSARDDILSACQPVPPDTDSSLPSQVVITRPQLLRSGLNKQRLTLPLEGTSGCDLPSWDLPGEPILFHDTHSENIQLLNNKSRARRQDSFCKGICFSHRPIAVNEKVYLKFVETNTSWNGVLRFGFTSIDPSSLQGCQLPRYACPDLTSKSGNWAKALGEHYTARNILLHFSVNQQGEVSYGVNGEEKGVFLTGVLTSQPLWALLDIYGNTVAVEFSHAKADIESPVRTYPYESNPNSPDCSLSSLTLSDGLGSPSSSVATHPFVRWHQHVVLSPLHFHRVLGRNVVTDGTVATRVNQKYSNAYVFTARPVLCGETLIIQVLEVDQGFDSGLVFGVTVCNPSTLHPDHLPDDPDLLLDRPEYWVVNKDVCQKPEVGDELSFFISSEGAVRYARNGQAPVTLLFVDKTLPLWVFFDVYGNMKQIKLLGITSSSCQVSSPHPQVQPYPVVQPLHCDSDLPISGYSGGGCSTSPLAASSPTDGNSLASPASPVWTSGAITPDMTEASLSGTASLPSTPVYPSMQSVLEEECSDCKVCWERIINCVLYTCGHMCLCFDCAQTIHKQKGLCPICRQAILDVIKIYKS